MILMIDDHDKGEEDELKNDLRIEIKKKTISWPRSHQIDNAFLIYYSEVETQRLRYRFIDIRR